ncbi:MAG: ribonuclease P protein subunit [Thermoplasmataceae archaeon]
MIEDYVSDFIGLRVKVVKHSNINNVGKTGTVVRESARMISINEVRKITRIPKATAEFSMENGTRTFNIIGDAVAMRPEERLKNYRKIAKNLRIGRGDKHY